MTFDATEKFTKLICLGRCYNSHCHALLELEN